MAPSETRHPHRPASLAADHDLLFPDGIGDALDASPPAPAGAAGRRGGDGDPDGDPAGDLGDDLGTEAALDAVPPEGERPSVIGLPEDTSVIPHRSRNGLLYLENWRVGIFGGSLILAGEYDGRRRELPQQSLSALLLGPQSSVSQEVLRFCAMHGTAVIAVGAGCARCYTAPPHAESGGGGARRHAGLWARAESRRAIAQEVWFRIIGRRYPGTDPEELRETWAMMEERDLARLAGREGAPWSGRRPGGADPANRAVDEGLACLRAAASIAVQVTGTVPQLGFAHADGAGWVEDLAQAMRRALLPAALKAAAAAEGDGARAAALARRACSDQFHRSLRRGSGSLVDEMIDLVGILLGREDRP